MLLVSGHYIKSFISDLKKLNNIQMDEIQEELVIRTADYL